MGPQFFVDGGFVCTYKGITRLLGRGSVRITPAHAGKRKIGISEEVREGDHPRTRGEKLLSKLFGTRISGSPPHTRGKDFLLCAPAHTSRITPAHAGKRRGSPPGWLGSGDHPRTRGEKRFICTSSNTQMGSPPHTRGKDGGLPPGRVGLGITPAHAGKRAGTWRVQYSDKDHPRTRGEKLVVSEIC